MSPRAAPMKPDDRRRTILDAVQPLLVEHGRAVSTRQIAEAAGIAEGTIFRVFESKDALIEAALARVFDPEEFLDAIDAIDLDQPLESRLLEATTLLQGRFVGIFQLMTALAIPKPPERFQKHELRRRLADGGLARVLRPDADQFRVPVEQVVALVRLLTFSGSHPHIVQADPLAPEAIVDVILHGTLKGGHAC